MQRVEAIEQNGLSQAFALRRYYLPHEDDSDINLARALWLNRQYFENLSIAVANGIAKVI
ncbi:DUF6890 family protein [Pasteurella multocida]|nr:hypothetical protein [Pasteurella multocida]HDR1874085.1 hypothetical protein [Pasteurella multocida]HDR1894445.1 hypothetical protein [Pasteurella multocida]HED4406658.1 hypothetical protein [Pasteurella multocida]